MNRLTRNMLLVTVTSVMLGFPSRQWGQDSGQFRGMSAQPVMYQKDAPLQVVGTKSARLDLLGGVLIVNLSDKTAIQAQIGWVATSKENRLSGEPFAGAFFDLALKPDKIYEAGRQG